MYGDLEEDKEVLMSWRSNPRLLRLVTGSVTFMTFLWLTPLVISFGGASTVSWWTFPTMATGLLGIFVGFVLFINGMYYRPKSEPHLISFEPAILQTCVMTYKGETVYMTRVPRHE